MTPHSITYLTVRAALRFAVLGAAAYLFGTFVQGLVQAQAGAWVVFGMGALFCALIVANWVSDALADRG
jgi:hypothetical protein